MSAVTGDVAPALDQASPPSYLPLRKVAAIGVGNALEFYDFLTYTFFSIQIGHCFFPDQTAKNSLLLSLATFGIGFIARPVGGFVIGRYGDRAGRKPAMMLSFTLMGVGITGLALTPSYAQIGMAAPVLLVCFRLLQGFALGGEVGPTTAYLIEAAPPNRRGLYVALQYATQDVAVLAAGLIGFTLSKLLDAEALDSWGWRLAFLIGVAVVPAGLAVRRSLPETLEAADIAIKEKVPMRVVGLGLALLMSGTIAAYVLNYMTTYAQDSLHMTPSQAFGAAIASGLALVIFEPIGGMMSDRFGRRPVALVAGVLLLLVIMPGFWLVLRLGTPVALYGAVGLFGALLAFYTSPVLVALTESLPKSVRCGSLAVIYAVSIAVFGGTAQFVVKFLTDLLDSPFVPGIYLCVALAIGLTALSQLEESAPGVKGRRS
jgi:MHS family citrate/tricarballylate:H+ symporter-like MFS transporter